MDGSGLLGCIFAALPSHFARHPFLFRWRKLKVELGVILHARGGNKATHVTRRRPMFFKTFIAIACTGFVVATSAQAQEFPSKNVTLMMPYAAGGPGDTLTRIIGQGMGKVLGRQFLVENTAGAGGTIGTAKVAASPPDGHSLLVMHFGHAANTALYRNLRYDPIKDFEPIGMIAESPMAFVARKDFPADNFNDFVAHVKTNREKVVHGHAGVGSASHLCGLLFLNAIEVTVTVVPYKGTTPAVTDLVAGQVQVMFDVTPTSLPHIKAGKLRPLGVTTTEPLPFLPDVPTIDSFVKGYEAAAWIGFGVPKGTPPEIIATLNKQTNAAVLDPNIQQRFADLGVVAVPPNSPEEFAKFIAENIDKWTKVIKFAGIKPE